MQKVFHMVNKNERLQREFKRKLMRIIQKRRLNKMTIWRSRKEGCIYKTSNTHKCEDKKTELLWKREI